MSWRPPERRNPFGTSVVAWRIDSIRAYDDLVALAPAWHALEVASHIDVPFQTWEWVTCWWRHLREDSIGIRDSLCVLVVRDDHGELIAIAPLMLTERPAVGPIRVRFLQFIGADPNMTEVRSVLCPPEHAERCYAAIREHLARNESGWDWIEWEGPVGPTNSIRGLSAGLRAAAPKSAYVLPLSSTWQELRGSLRRNIKESLRKCYNSLRREGMAYQLTVVEQRSDLERALADLFRLHTARAQLKGTVAHMDVFESPRARAFVTEVCAALAERGIAKIFELRVDDKLVASRLAFQMSDTLYLYYSGWEPAYARFSVMTTLVSEVVQYAIRAQLGAVHLSTGGEVSKTRWGPAEVRYATGVEVSRRRWAQLSHVGYSVAMQFRHAKLARALTPAALLRRSGKSAATPRPSVDDVLVHGLAGPAAAAITLDLIDGVLDRAVHFVAHC